MKVLWLTPWFGNYRVPVYKYLFDLCSSDFFLICSKENTSELVRNKLLNTLGDHCIVMEKEKVYTLTGAKNDSNFANSKLVIKRQPGLLKEIKKINPDVIITEGFGGWAPVGIYYKITHGKKLCMFYERTRYVERNSPWYKTLYRKIVGRAVDHFLINGVQTEEYLSQVLKFKNIPKSKGCMVADSSGLSIAVKSFSKEERLEFKKQLSITTGLTYLFVGQMVLRKGIDKLLSAWLNHIKSYPEDHLVVIGDGVLLEECKTQYGNQSNIHILGPINYSFIHKYYAICDVFIMPTLEDNWCLVLPEAMACEKAVACSIYNGGTVELIQDGVNGYSFDPLDYNSLVEVLSKFHASNVSVEQMGEASASIEKNFSPESAAKTIFNACVAVLE